MGSIVGTESLSRCDEMESSAQVEGLALGKSVSAGAPLWWEGIGCGHIAGLGGPWERESKSLEV